MLLVRGVIRGTVAVIRDIMEVVYGHGGDKWSKNNDNCIVKKRTRRLLEYYRDVFA